jgi:hypothetical protein
MKTSDKFEFFPGQRRKVELTDWRPLMNAQSEKRLRLDFLLALTGQNMIGIPNFVGPSYEVMDRENSALTETDLAPELEGVTVQVYSTDTVKFPIEIDTVGLNLVNVDEQLGRRHLLMTGATIRNFRLVRETRDKLALVCLKFSVTVPSDGGLVLWAHHYHGATFWAQFTETQDTMAAKKAAPANGDQLSLAPTEERTPEQWAAVRSQLEREGKACPYADNGMQCVLEIEHGSDHVLAAPVDLSPAAKKRSRAGRPN